MPQSPASMVVGQPFNDNAYRVFSDGSVVRPLDLAEMPFQAGLAKQQCCSFRLKKSIRIDVTRCDCRNVHGDAVAHLPAFLDDEHRIMQRHDRGVALDWGARKTVADEFIQLAALEKLNQPIMQPPELMEASHGSVRQRSIADLERHLARIPHHSHKVGLLASWRAGEFMQQTW